MARSGFVLTVDDRTPPLVVHEGDGFRLERFPLGTQVVYPAESLAPVADLREAIDDALDAPLEAGPLDSVLRPQMRLTIVFDDITVPTPTMRRPDLRGAVIEAVLTRAARAGVDDVELICANGLNRRLTSEEFQQLLGERVFRSFYADDKLRNHDAENPDGLAAVSGSAGIAINARVASSDLVVAVHLTGGPRHGGTAGLAAGLGSTATIGRLSGLRAVQGDETAAAEIVAAVEAAVPIFEIDVMLDNDIFYPPLDFLGKREWEWRIRDQARMQAVRQAIAATPTRLRRRLLSTARANYHATQIIAGAPAAVVAASREQTLSQYVVELSRQADVGVIGVPQRTPYSVGSVTNPILAAWQGLGATFGAHTGRPFVREGGALVLYHPMTADFSGLHHPSYVDFFADVLTSSHDPAQIQADFETKFATDPWYTHLYRTSYAFHGVHPCHLWYELSRARQHCSDIVWVGADRRTVDRLGFRAASTLADALEIVAASVGRAPTISYLHGPPQIVVDVR
jgi:lactate racemase-like protein